MWVKKFIVDLAILQFDLYVPARLQIESKVDYLLCLKSIIVFLAPLFVIVHLFIDLLMFALVTTTLI